MKILLILITLFLTNVAKGANGENLLPKPQKFTPSKSSFVLSDVKLTTPVLWCELEEFIVDRGGMIDHKSDKAIEVRIVKSIDGVTLNQDQAYSLVVNSRSIIIEAITERGVYWAIQTLAQLHEQAKREDRGCTIVDWPAFRVRGFMQDVGRTSDKSYSAQRLEQVVVKIAHR